MEEMSAQQNDTKIAFNFNEEEKSLLANIYRYKETKKKNKKKNQI